METKGNKGGSPNYFVTQTNPEIFEATPRPGGIAKIEIPQKPNRIREAQRKASTLDSRGRSRSRMSTSRMSTRSKQKSATAVPSETTSQSPSRKSLMTLSTTYGETKDMDIDSCPREFKVKQIIAATPWSVEFDEYLEPTEESRRTADPFQDSVDMLAMSFSVIMLLAKGYSELTESHFRWVLSFLECIRDDFGQVPPNIQGILNHINMVTGGHLKSYLDEEFDNMQDDRVSTVRISTVPPTRHE